MAKYQKGDKLVVKKGLGTSKFHEGQVVYFHSYGCSGALIHVVGSDGNLLGEDFGWIPERFEPAEKEPKLFNHEGVDYVVPEWAKYVTFDGHECGSKSLFAWENKPEHKGDDAGFRADRGMFARMRKYVKSLPEGAFIKEV